MKDAQRSLAGWRWKALSEPSVFYRIEAFCMVSDMISYLFEEPVEWRVDRNYTCPGKGCRWPGAMEPE